MLELSIELVSALAADSCSGLSARLGSAAFFAGSNAVIASTSSPPKTNTVAGGMSASTATAPRPVRTAPVAEVAMRTCRRG